MIYIPLNQRQILATTLHDLAVQFNNCEPGAAKNILKHAIYQIGRRLEDFCIPECSLAAIHLAQQNNIADLQNCTWTSRRNGLQVRSILCWEHVLPVSQFRDFIIDNPEQADVVIARYDIAWITHEENGILPLRRAENPWINYQAVGIEMDAGIENLIARINGALQ